MTELREYRARVLAAGAAWAEVVPASYVVTAPWVRYKCQFGCDNYGLGRLCPPATPTPEETAAVVAGYRDALLVVCDVAPGEDRRARRRGFHRDLLVLERELFLAGYYKALAFVSGPCNLCDECDVSEPCQRPGEPRAAMEACGIDVFATLARAGYRLEVARSEDGPHKICGLVLIS